MRNVIRTGPGMGKNQPITALQVHHGGPDLSLHTNTLSVEHPACLCGHVQAVFQDDGRVSFKADSEYFPLQHGNSIIPDAETTVYLEEEEE